MAQSTEATISPIGSREIHPSAWVADITSHLQAWQAREADAYRRTLSTTTTESTLRATVELLHACDVVDRLREELESAEQALYAWDAA